MMKKLKLIFMGLLVLGLVAPALGVDFEFHGDMNNRFLVYTNRNDWLSPEQQGQINRSTIDDEYGELKYRFWTEIGDDEDNIKGVYAIEIGGVRFGRTGSGKSEGGSFSGDAVNVETRWAYLDFQLPFIESKFRPRIGLQPFNVNRYLWQETIAGVAIDAQPTDSIGYQLAWMRGVDDLATDDSNKDIEDQDNFLGRLNWKPSDNLKGGVFALYQLGDPDAQSPAEFGILEPRSYEFKQFAGDAKVGVWNLGVDGTYKFNNFFVNWDLIYQTGDIDDVVWDDSEFSGVTASGDFDLSAYFAHVDLGLNAGKATFTYTFWYASGDDDPSDDDFEGYLSTDVDIDDNWTLFEGPYADDVTYFTERPYMLDKGFIMNKIAADYQWTEKLKVGGALMYMLTAEDIEYTDFLGRRQSNDEIGVEINGYAKYMLYKNLEVALGAGYLFADDALDAFEVGSLQDGSSDEDIFVSSARIRFRF